MLSPRSAPLQVAFLGLGHVGQEVLRQLTAPHLASLFRVSSLSNSKHTATSTGTDWQPADSLLALLPSSSTPLPASTDAVRYSPANPSQLLASLAATGSPTLVIDCTSDLSICNLYPSAIRSGLSIVTPNKKAFSSSHALWEDIVAAQLEPGAGFVYLEATVAAGLPIISTLRDLLKTGDEVLKVEGMLSGTLAFLFHEFSKVEGSTAKFSEIVRAAKARGYTVSPPSYCLHL